LPSFLAQLQAAKARTLKPSDPWTHALLTLKGNKGRDGVEWITTDAVFEFLNVPRLSRTPEAAKRLKGLMVELGWTPVRARAVTSRGRASRVRGYARQ
jgi:hypothetical protein